MATSTTDITEEMKKMMSIFSINKRNCFDKINTHLKEGTKRVMEDTAVCSSSASRRRPPLPHLSSLWML